MNRQASEGGMKNRDVIKAIENDGWRLVRQTSSHLIFKKQGVREIVTINGLGREEMKPGTLQSIRQTTGLELRP
jgi:predicted RNA binding protein YcfA (HicA-like mRNA interferase family)